MMVYHCSRTRSCDERHADEGEGLTASLNITRAQARRHAYDITPGCSRRCRCRVLFRRPLTSYGREIPRDELVAARRHASGLSAATLLPRALHAGAKTLYVIAVVDASFIYLCKATELIGNDEKRSYATISAFSIPAATVSPRTGSRHFRHADNENDGQLSGATRKFDGHFFTDISRPRESRFLDATRSRARRGFSTGKESASREKYRHFRRRRLIAEMAAKHATVITIMDRPPRFRVGHDLRVSGAIRRCRSARIRENIELHALTGVSSQDAVS